MPKPPRKPRPESRAVKEPVQVYLDAGDRAVLDGVAERTGLSRAEVLRRGLRAWAAQQQGEAGPMLRFIREMSALDWPLDTPADLAVHHDRYLGESHMDRHEGAR